MMPHLILLHGAIGCAAQTELLTPFLHKHFTLHHIELSGHGNRCNENPEYSIQGFADEVKAYLDSNHLKNVRLFGYSMGGYVGLLVASQSPERTEKLMTLGTKFDWSPEIAEKEASMLNAENIREKIPAFTQLLEARHGKDWDTVLARTAQMMRRLGENNPILHTRLEEMEIPVKLLLAEQDNMVTKTETEAIKNRIPQARFQQLSESKHPLEQVRLDLLAQEIIAFLGD